ncbi:MAG: hypothetical protein K2N94_07855 [Lachnospiraceae bacterium]|nr:hypothetical protein [Lachnospiraceae bacterium]
MKLWVDGKAGDADRAVRATVSGMVTDLNYEVVSRGVRAVNELRSAELRVLKGQRSGKRYRKPYTGGMSPEERKKKNYRPPMYTASAPGEAPARRTGNLRMHWNGQVKSENSSGGGVAIVAELESQEPYAAALENGTPKMAARPFAEKIKEEAAPEIRRIYSVPYT